MFMLISTDIVYHCDFSSCRSIWHSHSKQDKQSRVIIPYSMIFISLSTTRRGLVWFGYNRGRYDPHAKSVQVMASRTYVNCVEQSLAPSQKCVKNRRHRLQDAHVRCLVEKKKSRF